MALRVQWSDVSAEDLKEWGNTHTTVYAKDGSVLWEGLVAGWQCDQQSNVSLRRRCMLDDDHPGAFDIVTVQKDSWSLIETDGFTIDLDAILAQEAEQRAQQEAAEEAERQAQAEAALGLVGPGPNRQARRGGVPR